MTSAAGVTETFAAAGGIAAVLYPAIGYWLRRREKQSLAVIRTVAERTVREAVREASDVFAGHLADVKTDLRRVGDGITEMRVKQAKEFGGNSGGLREKVDRTDSKVDRLAEALLEHVNDSTRREEDIGKRIDKVASDVLAHMMMQQRRQGRA